MANRNINDFQTETAIAAGEYIMFIGSDTLGRKITQTNFSLSVLNGLTISITTGTLTVTNGKTISISNSLTFSGVDGSTINFGSGGTPVYTSSNLSVFAATTSAQLASIISDETGSGALVFANSPTLITPALGTPSSVSLTNAIGLPVATGISGLAAGVATFLSTPSSANLASAVTGETGTGALVFGTSPTLVTPDLGTPSAVVLTNGTGLPVGSGISGLGAGVATLLGTPSSANLASAITDETGSGSLVFSSSPSLTGTPLAPTAAGGTNTTQIATTSFVTSAISTAVSGLLNLKGSTDASGNPNYPAAVKGDSYYVTVAGKVGGASGKSVDIGDLYVASADNAGGTEAAVGTSWFVLEHNLVGALLSANNLSDLANANTAITNLGGAAYTGTGGLVRASSPTLVTPALGTPSAIVLTSGTGLPVSTGITGLGTGVATFLATPSSANLLAAVTDETGTGALVFANTPTLVTPVLGAATATSINGLTITTSTGILTVTNGKTISVSNTLTLAGTDAQTITFQGTDTYVGRATTDTLTNKRITQRVVSMADATSITPTGDTADENTQANTQSVGTLTVNAPSGTPTDGQKLILRIKSTNAQTFSWNAIYRGSTDLALPTVSSASSKTDYMGFLYCQSDSKWDLVAKVFGF